jgi:flagellar basal-body rod protein FlgG
MWMATEESGAPKAVDVGSTTKTIQGFLEKANVNPVTEMVQMISINRAYEANQKVISTQDSMTDKLINQAVRV